MKVTITEQHLYNIITESVKKNLLEFFNDDNNDLEPVPRYGTINFIEGMIENSNSEEILDYDEVLSVLNKFGLPVEMFVSYPESDVLDDKREKKFKELCEKIKSIRPSSDIEKDILSLYLDAVYNIEEYSLLKKYYRTELDIPDFSPDPDDYYEMKRDFREL